MDQQRKILESTEKRISDAEFSPFKDRKPHSSIPKDFDRNLANQKIRKIGYEKFGIPESGGFSISSLAAMIFGSEHYKLPGNYWENIELSLSLLLTILE